MRSLLIVDYDDTLLHSSEIEKKFPILGQHESWKDFLPDVEDVFHTPDQRKLFNQIITSQFEEWITKHDSVVVISNGEDEWVNLTCQRYNPTLYDVWQRHSINVISAKDRYKRALGEQPMLWKQHTMHDVVNLFQPDVVIGVGDRMEDRISLWNLRPLWPNVPFFTLKMQERPTVPSLLYQFTLLRKHPIWLMAKQTPKGSSCMHFDVEDHHSDFQSMSYGTNSLGTGRLCQGDNSMVFLGKHKVI
jgi:hypothetical protein